MITADDSVFPNNAVELIATRALTMDDDMTVLRRPLKKSDPVQAIGVWATLWTPEYASMEMHGNDPIMPSQPTLSRYTINVEAYIKDMDEQNGLATHSVLSTMIRAMLYRDNPLLVALRSLSVQTGSVTERVQRFTVQNQRFAGNELQGSFMYLSTTVCTLETETS